MSEKIYGAKWGHREWLVFVTIVLIAIVGVTIGAMTGPEKDITGTVSKTEPTTQQDGTAGHPYADASHCPSKVGIIFWSKNDQPIPTMLNECSESQTSLD
jgi:hypothetical protein